MNVAMSLKELGSVKYLATQALPTIGVLLLQTGLSMLEMIYISKLGTFPVAGASVVMPLLLLMTTLSAAGIGGGVNASVAQSVAHKDTHTAQRILWHSTLLAIAIGGLLMFLGWTLSPRVYDLLGAKGQTLTYATQYTQGIVWGLIPMWCFNLLAAGLRGAGEASLPAKVMVISALWLLIANPILMFGMGDFQGYGIQGAGLALSSYYGLATLILIMLLWNRPSSKLTLRVYAWKPSILQSVLSIGLPSAIGTLLSSLVTLLLTASVTPFGEQTLVGYTIASRLDASLIPLLFGIGSALTAIIGRAKALRAYHFIQHQMRRVILGVSLFTTLLGVCVYWYPESWIGLFKLEPQATTQGVMYLSTVGITYGFFATGLIGYFTGQGLGYITPSFLSVSFRLFSSLLGWWLVSTQHLTYPSLLRMMALGYVLSGIIPLVLLEQKLKRLIDTNPSHP
ncbi:MAG: MATE family efflux transporter [Vampirovibrionales bacterium]